MQGLVSLLGILVLFGIAYLASAKRKSINWRTVGIALSLQVFFGAFVLYIPAGKEMLLSVSSAVSSVIGFGQQGITFLFGDIAKFKLGFIFAFHVLPIIVFFSAFIAVLYHIGLMGKIINAIGGILQKALGTSRPESMSAAANIFVGQTEAPLIVRPFIKGMTQSELFAVMVGGLASVAGSVLAGYAGIGVDIKYLVAASFMAAPGGLLMAKLIMPETETPTNDLEELDEPVDKPVNVIDAAASGASSGMQLALNVGAMLLAFVALIALLNGLLGYVGGLFGYPDFTLQLVLGYVFQPLAWVLGVPWHEAQMAGSFIGQKLVVNEFVAYADFVQYKDQLSESTQAIVTFALCGFANLSSIAILLGGLGGMAPSRRHDIARLGLKAVLAASLANLMSAAIAGLFLSF
ncbi:NupC/NupG family nucleoside CNT transporter [Flocculibacter collagenilyticus]|uniref:NupC/NupG family nucleoside CNT transporter n=1 Tax=Flocculibacter collagenilyticus TaxID=2744479 RepID=UPI0018F31DD9|nr:NupC/NupG family nucleoside CNT transporter [Flocculibacter collagenilyticus]